MNETVPSNAFAAVGQSWEVDIYRTQREHGTEEAQLPTSAWLSD